MPNIHEVPGVCSSRYTFLSIARLAEMGCPVSTPVCEREQQNERVCVRMRERVCVSERKRESASVCLQKRDRERKSECVCVKE